MRAARVDRNQDGRPDQITVSLQLPESPEEVTYVLGALAFYCRLVDKARAGCGSAGLSDVQMVFPGCFGNV